MEYRPLGGTGVKVSPLALGGMNFGGRTDPETAARIVRQAIDAGLNLVDTADVYGHDPGDFSIGRGRSEEIIGRALRGVRDRVVLATKAHFPVSDDPNDQGNRPYLWHGGTSVVAHGRRGSSVAGTGGASRCRQVPGSPSSGPARRPGGIGSNALGAARAPVVTPVPACRTMITAEAVAGATDDRVVTSPIQEEEPPIAAIG